MSMKKVLLASVLGSAFALSAVVPAMAEIEGKVTGVENEGRQVMIGDKSIAISNSGTKVMIGGKEGKRDQVKVGMTCKADSEKATMLDCQ
jgi:hypothetical protein